MVIRKSLREAILLFIYPRFASSITSQISSILDQLMQTRDKEAIRRILISHGLFRQDEWKKFEDLNKIETCLIEMYEQEYDRFNFYMPEDLKKFLEDFKTIRDCKNLKTLLRCIVNGVPAEDMPKMLGSKGKVNYENLKILSQHLDHQEMIRDAMQYLPSEIVSGIENGDKATLDDFEVTIERAAARYIIERCSIIRTENSEKIRNIIGLRYEIKDISTIARLKKAQLPHERINSQIIGQHVRLSNEDLQALISAQNYNSFYNELQSTHYGTKLPETPIKPLDLELALNKMLIDEMHGLQTSIQETPITRFVLSLENKYQTIWKALALSFIGG